MDNFRKFLTDMAESVSYRKQYKADPQKVMDAAGLTKEQKDMVLQYQQSDDKLRTMMGDPTFAGQIIIAFSDP